MREYKGIKLGDAIIAYHAGYHILMRIQERTMAVDQTDSPLFYYKTIDIKKNTLKPQEKVCDASFCSHASNSIDAKIKELEKTKRLILKLSK